jgi:hypothetical protein
MARSLKIQEYSENPGEHGNQCSQIQKNKPLLLISKNYQIKARMKRGWTTNEKVFKSMNFTLSRMTNKKGMSKSLILIIGLIIISVIVGFVLIQQKNQTSTLTTCDELSENFDKLVDIGCIAIANNNEIETTAGATIVSIGQPVFVGDPKEYNYAITFKGKAKEKTFVLVNQKNISIDELLYKSGEYYKFDFRSLCGDVFSSGPHGGGMYFVDNDLNALKNWNC